VAVLMAAADTTLRRTLIEYGQTTLAVLALLVTWEVLCNALSVPKWLLPAPSQIATETWEMRAVLPMHFGATIAATVAFFPIVINTATGLESVDKELLELTSSLDASTARVFWRVRLPWALPYIFSSFKVAITLAVIGAVVAEFVGSDKGLGYLILTSSGAMKTSVTFGVLLLLSLLGIASFYAVAWAERRLCPWYLRTSTDPAAT
jgi:ABC-type nitrate/sulfonate/bicarbonate transport system permease component